MVHGWRDEQCAREGAGYERREVHVPGDVLNLRKALLERQDEEEREQHLHPRERDPQLVQELDQLAIDSLLGALVGFEVSGFVGCCVWHPPRVDAGGLHSRESQ